MSENTKAPIFSNPAAVGLAGFGGTTFLLQLNNLGITGPGVVLWTGFFFGGLMQLIAGLQEFRTGNNFGFAVFSTYGAFWLTIGGILMSSQLGLFNIGSRDIGWTLVMFTIITFIFLFGALRQNGAVSLIFTTLVIGFVLLDIGHLSGEGLFNKVGAGVLILCALSAWYMMANIILKQFNINVPVGKPWVK